ncbi:hypothetical protein IMSAG192_01054 [Muribaculaceae bacterium]|nr:hypothetical protein IMSAG192_01054 [Muribaculaceae bacterium]
MRQPLQSTDRRNRRILSPMAIPELPVYTGERGIECFFDYSCSQFNIIEISFR